MNARLFAEAKAARYRQLAAEYRQRYAVEGRGVLMEHVGACEEIAAMYELEASEVTR